MVLTSYMYRSQEEFAQSLTSTYFTLQGGEITAPPEPSPPTKVFACYQTLRRYLQEEIVRVPILHIWHFYHDGDTKYRSQLSTELLDKLMDVVTCFVGDAKSKLAPLAISRMRYLLDHQIIGSWKEKKRKKYLMGSCYYQLKKSGDTRELDRCKHHFSKQIIESIENIKKSLFKPNPPQLLTAMQKIDPEIKDLTPPTCLTPCRKITNSFSSEKKKKFQSGMRVEGLYHPDVGAIVEVKLTLPMRLLHNPSDSSHEQDLDYPHRLHATDGEGHATTPLPALTFSVLREVSDTNSESPPYTTKSFIKWILPNDALHLSFTSDVESTKSILSLGLEPFKIDQYFHKVGQMQ